MTLTQREHPEAVAEFDDAVRWYEAQEPEIDLGLSTGCQPIRLPTAFLAGWSGPASSRCPSRLSPRCVRAGVHLLAAARPAPPPPAGLRPPALRR